MRKFINVCLCCLLLFGICVTGLGCTGKKAAGDIDNINIPKVTMSYFNVNGHSWIIYSGGDVFDGIIHDPDCKCNTRE